MKTSSLQFQITELRQRSVERSIEAILVVITALFSIAVLPSLILRYFYAEQQLFEQPKSLEYLPVVVTVIAAYFVLRAILGNMKRNSQVRNLMMELEMMDDDCCGSSCGDCDSNDEDEDWDDDLKELEELLAEVEAEEAEEKKKSEAKESKKKTTKSKAAKTKKTTKAKKSTKKSKK